MGQKMCRRNLAYGLNSKRGNWIQCFYADVLPLNYKRIVRQDGLEPPFSAPILLEGTEIYSLCYVKRGKLCLY